jgi:hypothetical protein
VQIVARLVSWAESSPTGNTVLVVYVVPSVVVGIEVLVAGVTALSGPMKWVNGQGVM